MDTAAFLRHVLPDAGPYCVAIGKIKPDGTKPYWHYPAYSIEHAAAQAKELEDGRENIFFAVGSLIIDKAWDVNAKGVGFWRTSRSAGNIRGLRSYIIDIDAGVRSDGSPREYVSVADGLVALQEFIAHYQLPQPTVVNSGSGLHVYWTLTEEVAGPEWKLYGAVLKGMATKFGLRIDGGRTADSASVLRVVGAHNYKYNPAPEIVVMLTGVHTPTASFHAQLQLQEGVDIKAKLFAGGPQVDIDGSNTGEQPKERPVLNFPGLFNGCQIVRGACTPATQATTPEPIWHYTVMLVRFCGTPEQGRKLAHIISEKDTHRYNKAFLDAKIDRFEKENYGPTNCVTFQKYFAEQGLPNGCIGCPSLGKIVSPAQIARHIEVAPPIITITPDGVEQEIPPPPEPFVRTAKGIGIKVGNPRTGAPDITVFCAYDMYPVRLRYDEKTKLSEQTMWCVNLPHEGWVTLDIPFISKQQLSITLAKRGIHINAAYIDHMENFMTAYIRKLQNETPREVAYAKMGWRKDGGFVVGDTLYRKNGTNEQHAMSDNLNEATHHGMRVEGEYDLWQQAAQKYNRPGLEDFRIYLYSTFASVLYPMTGQIATCVSATGLGGVGKSTLQDMCASAWGDPRAIVTKGNSQGSTRAAAEVVSDAMHNLPIFLDEISDREAREMAEFIFNYSGGKGKIRSKSGGGLRGDTATWSNLALVNANADEYERMASVYKDSAPHLVRLVQLEFSATNIISKDEGDTIRTIAQENFGHAGRVFAEYIAQHQIEIRDRVKRYNREADKAVVAKSEERFWTAWLASLRAAAEICLDLGILASFPVTLDMQYATKQITLLRGRIATHVTSSDAMLSEFMDAEISHTLIISAKGAGNIDNIKGEPRGGFTIRNEPDIGFAWVSRNALQKYCVDRGIAMTRHLRVLYQRGVVTQENMRKVLGAGTQYATGNVHCVEIDTSKLSGRTQPAPVNNVVPITVAAGTK